MSSTITAGNATNGLALSCDNTGILELKTGTGSGTTAITADASQNVKFASSISVGNVAPTTSGFGITFPATQSASTDANTLDDYEEGTWTPSWTAASGSMTVSSTSASYVKIGKTVHIYGFVAISAASGASGLDMSGLPFTVSNTPGVRQIIVAREDQSTGKMGQLFLNNNATTGGLQDYTGAVAVISANWTWVFNGVYQTT